MLSHEDGDVYGSARFRCYVKSVQCTARVTRGNRRCQNNTIMGLPYCYAHTLSKQKLLIKASAHVGHEGKGVFAHNVIAERGRVFKEGDVICSLEGEVRSTAQMKRRYGSIDNIPYGIFVVHPTLWLDGACLRSIGMLINHAPASRANVRLSFDYDATTRKADFFVIALHDINHGTELLMNWNWRNVQGWRAPRQENHRTYNCKFSNTWDNKYRDW